MIKIQREKRRREWGWGGGQVKKPNWREDLHTGEDLYAISLRL